MSPFVGLAPDGVSVEHQEHPRGPGNSGLAQGWQRYPRRWLDVRAWL